MLMTAILETSCIYSQMERIVFLNEYMMFSSAKSFNHSVVECPDCGEAVGWPGRCDECGADVFDCSGDSDVGGCDVDEWACSICDGGLSAPPAACGCCRSAQCSVYCGCRCASEFYCALCRAYHAQPCLSEDSDEVPW